MPRGIPRIPEPWEWVKTRACARCGQVKPWAKFAPARYWPDGTVRRVACWCHECDAARTRARLADVRAARDDRWDRYEGYRQQWVQRKRAALAAERSNGGSMLDVAPLRGLLGRVLAAEADQDVGVTLLAARCGVDDRTLRRLLAEQSKTSLRIADQICVRLGVRIYDLWPELEDLAA